MIEEQINIFKDSQKFDEINLDMKQLIKKNSLKNVFLVLVLFFENKWD